MAALETLPVYVQRKVDLGLLSCSMRSSAGESAPSTSDTSVLGASVSTAASVNSVATASVEMSVAAEPAATVGGGGGSATAAEPGTTSSTSVGSAVVSVGASVGELGTDTSAINTTSPDGVADCVVSCCMRTRSSCSCMCSPHTAQVTAGERSPVPRPRGGIVENGHKSKQGQPPSSQGCDDSSPQQPVDSSPPPESSNVPSMGSSSSQKRSLPSLSPPELARSMYGSNDSSQSRDLGGGPAVAAGSVSPAAASTASTAAAATFSDGKKKTKNNLSSRDRMQRRSRSKHAQGRTTKQDLQPLDDTFDDSIFDYTDSSLSPPVKRLRKVGRTEINKGGSSTPPSTKRRRIPKPGQRAIIWFKQKVGGVDRLVPYIGIVDGIPADDRVKITYSDGTSKFYKVQRAVQFIDNYDAYSKGGDKTAGVEAITNAEGCKVVEIGNNSDDGFGPDSNFSDGDDSSYASSTMDSEDEWSSSDGYDEPKSKRKTKNAPKGKVESRGEFDVIF